MEEFTLRSENSLPPETQALAERVSVPPEIVRPGAEESTLKNGKNEYNTEVTRAESAELRELSSGMEEGAEVAQEATKASEKYVADKRNKKKRKLMQQAASVLAAIAVTTAALNTDPLGWDSLFASSSSSSESWEDDQVIDGLYYSFRPIQHSSFPESYYAKEKDAYITLYVPTYDNDDENSRSYYSEYIYKDGISNDYYGEAGYFGYDPASNILTIRADGNDSDQIKIETYGMGSNFTIDVMSDSRLDSLAIINSSVTLTSSYGNGGADLTLQAYKSTPIKLIGCGNYAMMSVKGNLSLHAYGDTSDGWTYPAVYVSDTSAPYGIVTDMWHRVASNVDEQGMQITAREQDVVDGNVARSYYWSFGDHPSTMQGYCHWIADVNTNKYASSLDIILTADVYDPDEDKGGSELTPEDW